MGQAANAECLGREPGSGPQDVTARMEQAIAGYGRDPRSAQLLQRLACEHPDVFFGSAARHLASNTESPAGRRLAIFMIRQDSFFERLTNPSGQTLEGATRLFRCLLGYDPTLDFRLARMLPGRNGTLPANGLSKESAVRAMDILEQTSKGQRLFSVLGHLPNSGEAQLAAKAALFVGRRADNPDWTAKQLLSENNRLRANVLEAFWDSASRASPRILGDCLRDDNDRVAGNALVALHLGGHPGVEEETIAMSRAADSGRRATAAWAMGKIGKPSFTERLLELMKDEKSNVRSTAIRSLAAIRRVERQQLNSLPANEIAVEAATETAVSPQAVESGGYRVPAERRPDNSILKLNR